MIPAPPGEQRRGRTSGEVSEAAAHNKPPSTTREQLAPYAADALRLDGERRGGREETSKSRSGKNHRVSGGRSVSES